jgi:SulP family sulfate permease
MINRQTAWADLMAGITGAIVVLPQGVAFATIAGMPPEYGLYAGMIPAITAALFGSSWHLVSGPTTAASIVLFSSLSILAQPGTAEYVQLALTLAFMVGLLQLVMGLFKLGAVVNFVSHSVVIGFTAGAGALIAATQIKNFFGMPMPRGLSFVETLGHFFTHLPEISWPTTIVALVTLLTGIVIRRFAPRIPYMVVAILVGSLLSVALNAYARTGIEVVGALPAHLPPLSMPHFDHETWQHLAPTALAVTMFALTEALSISRALAVKSGQHIDPSQEFVGQGLSNIAGSFFSGYVATGSFNRSGANYDAGARTPLASIIAGFLLMGLVIFVAPLAAYMPNAAMGGILFLVAWGLIDWHHIVQIVRTSKAETAVMTVTLLSTLLFDLELAIFAGVMLSLGLYLNRTANPSIVTLVPDPLTAGRKFSPLRPGLRECPQLRVIRVDGSLFFGAVPTFQETLRGYEREENAPKHLAIIMTGMNFIDIAGAEAIVQMAQRYRDRGGGLYLIGVKDRVRETLEKGGYLDELGHGNLFTSKTMALRSLYRVFDYETCRTCVGNVFVECGRLGKQEPLDDGVAAAVALASPARPA